MQKGHTYDLHQNEIPKDFVWFTGMKGVRRITGFKTMWENADNFKRAVMHQPALSVDDNIYENVDEFCALLAELGKNNWDANPVIVDIWDVGGDARLSINDLLVYGQKFFEKLAPKHKLVLRIIPSVWEYWTTQKEETKAVAFRLLDYFEIMYTQPGFYKPIEYITPIGWRLPKWFEYEFGLIAYNPTGQWLENVTTPPVIVEPEPEPEEPGEVVPPVVSKLPDGRFYLFGFLPIGKIRFKE